MLVVRPFSAPFRLGLVAAATAMLGLVAGCSYSHGDPAAVVVPCDASAQTATYAAVISPIFDKNCRECHANNVASTLGGGTMLGDYQSIKNYPAADLLGSIRRDPGYSAMPKGRDKISECDILRIKAWMDAGQLNN